MTSEEQDPPAVVDPADLVAELDDEPDPTLADTDEPDDPPRTYTGVARGGPCDGDTLTVRFSKGFLWIDRAQQLVWIYDRVDGAFTARERAFALDDERRWAVAEDEEFDILVPDMAAPEEGEP